MKTRSLEVLKKDSLDLIKEQKPIPCPALGDELIKIDRVLFDHIAKGKARTPEELRKRLNIIPLAFILIEKINIYQKHTIEASKQTEFWTLTGVIDSTRL